MHAGITVGTLPVGTEEKGVPALIERRQRVEDDVQGSKILMVDDSADNLRLLTAVMERGGLVPRPVTSGKLAIKAAEASPPDLWPGSVPTVEAR